MLEQEEQREEKCPLWADRTGRFSPDRAGAGLSPRRAFHKRKGPAAGPCILRRDLFWAYS